MTRLPAASVLESLQSLSVRAMLDLCLSDGRYSRGQVEFGNASRLRVSARYHPTDSSTSHDARGPMAFALVVFCFVLQLSEVVWQQAVVPPHI